MSQYFNSLLELFGENSYSERRVNQLQKEETLDQRMQSCNCDPQIINNYLFAYRNFNRKQVYRAEKDGLTHLI